MFFYSIKNRIGTIGFLTTPNQINHLSLRFINNNSVGKNFIHRLWEQTGWIGRDRSIENNCHKIDNYFI